MQRAVINREYAKNHMARAVPGAYYNPDEKGWCLDDPTPRAAAVALRLFPDLLREEPWLADERDKLAQDVRPFDNATPFDTNIEADGVRAALASEGKSLYGFQSIDTGYLAAILRAHGGAYLGWERGLGKTLGTCALVDHLGCRRTLVVCPNTAKRSVWADEIARWLPGHEVFVLPNTKAKREKMLAEFTRGDAAMPYVLVVHYEALAIIAGKERKSARRVDIGHGWDKLGSWDLVVADEVHRIKEPKAQMARALKRVPAAMKLGLSGSIIQNHAEELYSVLNWLFPMVYRSKWRDWNDRYLDYIDGAWGRICVGIKMDRVEEMRQELGVFMTYRRKEDELDLPSKTIETRFVDLSPGQRKVYGELQVSCSSTLDDGTKLKAADGLAMLGRLRQVATGLDLFSGEVHDSAKLDLAQEMVLDNPDEAFVIFTWYKAAGRALADRLMAQGVAVAVVDGDVPHEERSDLIERFQGGEFQVFVGTLATLAESVTLHRASNAIFIDRDWNPARNVQAEDRIYRIGQDRPVTITHIVARNTVDELRVTPTLVNKEALRALILGGTS